MHVSIMTAFGLMETLFNSGKYPEGTMVLGSEGCRKEADKEWQLKMQRQGRDRSRGEPERQGCVTWTGEH